MLLGADMNGTHPKIRLHVPESTLHIGKVLVCLHRLFGTNGVGRKVGADNIYAVKGRRRH